MYSAYIMTEFPYNIYMFVLIAKNKCKIQSVCILQHSRLMVLLIVIIISSSIITSIIIIIIVIIIICLLYSAILVNPNAPFIFTWTPSDSLVFSHFKNLHNLR